MGRGVSTFCIDEAHFMKHSDQNALLSTFLDPEQQRRLKEFHQRRQCRFERLEREMLGEKDTPPQ